MTERERVKEQRKRNLKRVVFLGAVTLFFVRRSLRKRRRRAEEIERSLNTNGIA